MPRALVRPDIVYAWNGPSLLILDAHGHAGPHLGLTGFFFRETRFLRTCRLTIDGVPPWLCEAGVPASNALDFVYVYPEITEYGGGGSGQSGDDVPRSKTGLPQRSLILTVRYAVTLAGLSLVARIENRSRETLACDLEWTFDADFADVQEAQSGRRQQDALIRLDRTPDGMTFRYQSAALPYATAVHLPRAFAWETGGGRAATRVRIEPGQRVEMSLTFDANDGQPGMSDADMRAREDALSEWRHSFTRTTAPGNRLFERVFEANVTDFGTFPLLEGSRDEWLIPQAGMPLYPALFGRDAITSGWQAALIDRGQSLEAALARLGRLQSDRFNDWRDEEPGRIPYQVRVGPLAKLNINPYSAYYADYASPLMYVIGLATHYAWTGDETLLRRHWDTARRILDWAREHGDQDGDGYLEYRTRSPVGTKNQGWKDSGDAIVYDDGSTVAPPIATCELQAYWFEAQQLMAALCWMTNRAADANALFASATDLKARFNRDWWIPGQECFALAMDARKQLIGAVTSNVGHCLAAGIIDAEHIPRVVGRLFAPDMFSGWGIRTLSTEHSYYDPLSYHRGSVWPVEQGTIVFGLRRFGFDARAQDLAKAMVDLAQLYPDYRIPECVGGYSRGERTSPGAYPQANTPQLWNATAFPLILQSLLGLVPLAPSSVLLVDPALPDWIPDLTLRNLRVGPATVSLRFRRDADGTSDFDVLSKRGTLRIVRQPPPESLSAGAWDRIAGLADTVRHTASSFTRRRAS